MIQLYIGSMGIIGVLQWEKDKFIGFNYDDRSNAHVFVLEDSNLDYVREQDTIKWLDSLSEQTIKALFEWNK